MCDLAHARLHNQLTQCETLFFSTHSMWNLTTWKEDPNFIFFGKKRSKKNGVPILHNLGSHAIKIKEEPFMTHRIDLRDGVCMFK
jgi:hypothetical protein